MPVSEGHTTFRLGAKYLYDGGITEVPTPRTWT